MATWLQHKLDKRAVVLDQISTDGSLKTRLRGLASLHAGFVMQCRAIGITGADYPLNTERMRIRSLSTYMKAELLNKFGAAARTASASRTQALPRPGFDPRHTASRPYQIVEFDGHRLDVRLKIVIRDPLGFEQEVKIERVWLLVIIDVCTRAVLGYNLVLSREYSRYDVIKTIERALVPHTPRTFTLPEVGYGTSGGFPSGRLPELGYPLWNRIRLDNARSNLAEDTLSVLAEFIGCAIDAGPMHYPNDRPYIERFFGTIGSTLSSRLLGYTGSSPRDVRRALADPKGNLRLFVSLTEIGELMEASIAGYNATPHSGLNGRTRWKPWSISYEARRSCSRGCPRRSDARFALCRRHIVAGSAAILRRVRALTSTYSRCAIRMKYLLRVPICLERICGFITTAMTCARYGHFCLTGPSLAS